MAILLSAGLLIVTPTISKRANQAYSQPVTSGITRSSDARLQWTRAGWRWRVHQYLEQS